MRYSFPGNVGELEQMVDRAAALGRNAGALQPWDLCGFQTCPYLGGAPQPNCRFSRGFDGEGRQGTSRRPPRLLLHGSRLSGTIFFPC